MPDFSAPKVTVGLRPVDERKSLWVLFPHLNSCFLLPLVQHGRKLVPVFYEDGSIGVESKDVDPELATMVDGLMLSISKEEAKEREVLVGLAGWSAFIKLVRKLLLTNYDITDSRITEMLTMTNAEFGAMYRVIFSHCFGR